MAATGTFHALLARDGPNCHYCGKYLWESLMTKEHVVPRSLGGPSSLDNLALACAPCNRGRGNQNAPHKGCEFCAAARDKYGHHTPPPPVKREPRRRPQDGWATAPLVAARIRAENYPGRDMLSRAGEWPGSAPKVDGHREA